MAGNWSSETSWTNVTATTLDKYFDVFTDSFFKKNAILAKLLQKSITVRGGKKVGSHTEVGRAASSGVVEGYQTMDTAPKEFIKNPQVDWRTFYGTVIITHDEKVKNSGEAQVVDLLEAKFKNADKTLRDEICYGLFSDGTDYTYQDGRTKGIDGFKIICDDSTNYQYYAGLDRDATAWDGTVWEGNYTDLSTTNIRYSDMRSMIGDLTEKGGSSPDLIVTTRDIYDYLAVIMEPARRYNNPGMATMGFTTDTWNVEGIPVISDYHCTAGYMYFLNFDDLKFFISPEGNFKREGLQKPINQEVWVARVILTCNLLCTKCNSQGVIKGISTS